MVCLLTDLKNSSFTSDLSLFRLFNLNFKSFVHIKGTYSLKFNSGSSQATQITLEGAPL